MADELADVFASIYDERKWGGGSGAGSRPMSTIRYRYFLETFLDINKVRTVLDIGCGDWQFSRLIDWSRVKYLGLDVVASLVEANAARYGAENIRFAPMPSDFAELPAADLLIIKDVLMHLPLAHIQQFISIFPRFKFCLVSNDFWWKEQAHQLNIDIKPGGIRPIDLSAPPFSVCGAYVFEHMKQSDRKLFRTFLVTGIGQVDARPRGSPG